MVMGDALEAAVDAELDAWESRTLQQQPGLVGVRDAVRKKAEATRKSSSQASLDRSSKADCRMDCGFVR